MIKCNHRNDVRKKKDQLHGKTAGFTRLQIPSTLVIIMMLVTVATGYQRSMDDAKLSKTRAAAARVSMLLLEEWKAAAGDPDFDPVSVLAPYIPICKSAIGPRIIGKEECRNLSVLGSYEIEIEETYYYVTLFANDVSSLKPKGLHATVTWRRDHGQGVLQGDEWAMRYSTVVAGY